MSARHYLYHYAVTHYKVYDGDTVKLILDLGFGIPLGRVEKIKTWRAVRIFGVDTPEKRGPQRIIGKAVTAVVVELLAAQADLVVKSIKLDKYAGRFVGDIVLDNGDMLSNFLLNLKLAKPYDGGKKSPWTKKELADVLGRCANWNVNKWLESQMKG